MTFPLKYAPLEGVTCFPNDISPQICMCEHWWKSELNMNCYGGCGEDADGRTIIVTQWKRYIGRSQQAIKKYRIRTETIR